ncbi:MAG: O-antigen ligase family protein, partial [Burkholderiaceae bacterium]|nr:O-antigen ligase family protein [Burkholderiaceae bacterium]
MSLSISPQALAWRYGASVAAFLIPALALWVPSGYSWGAALFLAFALMTGPQWWRGPFDAATKQLLALLPAMAVLWAIDTGPHPSLQLAGQDISAKYLLALPCLVFAMAAPPRPMALWAGIATGAVGSGVLALLQSYFWDMERATGYISAVQYGGFSLVLGLFSLAALAVLWRWLKPGMRCWLALGGAMGLLASLLSQTRGSWLALGPALLVIALMLWRAGHGRRLLKVVGVFAVLLLMAWSFQHRTISERLALIEVEVSAYRNQGEANTSIGQRLEHWRLALRMGADRPLLGWGRAYSAEKQRRVDAGLADAVVARFWHAHNEWLDMFARRGLVGLLVLALYLAWPLRFFWRHRKTALPAAGVAVQPEAMAAQQRALCVAGVLLPVCYFVFGWTDVYFSHNNGHAFYMFMLILLVA